MRLTFNPIVNWIVLLVASVLMVGGLIAIIVYLTKTKSQNIGRWYRRLAIVILLVLSSFRPSFYSMPTDQAFSNVDVYFLVDTTISMMAEDHAGSTRLEGAISDVEELMKYFVGARFSVLNFDNVVSSNLPLTTDASAAKTSLAVAFVPDRYKAKGSDIGLPADTLVEILDKQIKSNPDRSRIVFYLGDGENTGKTQTSMEPIKRLIDGGAVLGYGTEQGGQMIDQWNAYRVEYYDWTTVERDKYIMATYDEPAVSKMDYDNLRLIADQMGLNAFRRTDGGDLKDVASTIKVTGYLPSGKEGSSVADLYWVLILVVICLLVWDWQVLLLHYQKITQLAGGKKS